MARRSAGADSGTGNAGRSAEAGSGGRKETTEEWKEEQSTAYTLVTEEWYELGDKVIYEGIKLVICEKPTYLEKNILMSRYILKKEAGLRQAKYGNEKIVGASIGGRVLEVEKDRVKLHLDIDEKQDSGKAFWYQYNTVYQAAGRESLQTAQKI